MRARAVVATGFLVAALSVAAQGEDRLRNNFVTEYALSPVAAAGDEAPARYAFTTRREGWILLLLPGAGPGTRVCLDSSDPKDAAIVVGPASTRRPEAMRFVGPGRHTVRVFASGSGPDARPVVRSIPEIVLFPLSFAAWKKETSANYGLPKGWEFFKKHMLPDSNTITFFNVEDFGPYIEECKRQGKKILIKKNIPAYGSTPDQLYEDWGRPLTKHAKLDGLTIDEFGPSEKHQELYARWVGVFDRIGRDFPGGGKKVYAFWGSSAPRKEMRPLVEAVQRNNFRWLHEGYYMLRKSEGGEAGQLAYITGWGGNKFEQFRKMFPGLIENNLLYTFGVYDYHWTCDLTPELDFKVFLDLQFHHVANHPAFRDIYGACLYTLNSTTEEMCRYASALVRHYCIQGRAERFNPDPLELTHIKNPGFEKGTAHWRVDPAAPGSVKPLAVSALPYKNTVTDRAVPNEKMVLCTTRHEAAPNRISQEIANLRPGGTYSVRVMTADVTDLAKASLVPIAIEIGGAEIIEEAGFDRPWTTSFDAIEGGGKVTAGWSFRMRVFRARTDRATLTLSDWADGDGPGDEVGHKVVWDFIKVQPFHAVADGGRR